MSMNITGPLLKVMFETEFQSTRLLEANRTKGCIGGPCSPTWKLPFVMRPFWAIEAVAGSLSTSVIVFVVESRLVPVAETRTVFIQSAMASSTTPRLKLALV